MLSDLLPGNATAWERALGDALDTNLSVSPAIAAIRGTKLLAPPPSFLPFLIYEYGLGELTPFVPNLYELIAEGIDWQRVRGTPAAIDLALEWLEYAGSIVEASSHRRFWNLFQLHLSRVRDTRADLDRIAGLAGLSVPRRSLFWRGYHGLDIRPLTFAHGSWSEAHFGEFSGRRLREGGPLWSFGRVHEFDHTLPEADLVELGIWLEPAADEDLGWGDFSWDSTEASWESDAVRARSEAMASGAEGRRIWFAFYDMNGAVIGYRRARTSRVVAPAVGGPYRIGGARYVPTGAADTRIYAECQTGFGDGDGTVAKSFGLVFDATPADVTRSGQMWLAPDEISGGTAAVAVSPIDIAFGESIRERVKVLLRF
jgi:Phage tail protein (Tail_P2_I)